MHCHRTRHLDPARARKVLTEDIVSRDTGFRHNGNMPDFLVHGKFGVYMSLVTEQSFNPSDENRMDDLTAFSLAIHLALISFQATCYADEQS